ncbi:MAG: mucoidy inhibitor MuiA family protein [Bacteroidota bacterium]
MDYKLKERSLQLRVEQIRNEINKSVDAELRPISEIIVKVKADQEEDAKFRVSYLVQNAGWFPKYDIRVEDISKPINLEYKADVYQQTGVDWEKVKLKLSNADPNKSGQAPELSTWFLNFDRNSIYQRNFGLSQNDIYYNPNQYRLVSGVVTDEDGEPLPGVTVLVQGTTRGTTTSLDGSYQISVNGNERLVFSYVGFDSQEVTVGSRGNIDIALGGITELQEVVVTGFAARGQALRSSPNDKSALKRSSKITTSIVQNTTSFVFVVEEPYTVSSSGDRLTVDLKTHAITTDFQYYAVPKIQQDVFLRARLTDWNQYNLLQGEASLFFEGTFVGQTVLNPTAFGDTLDLSLGIDRSIAIQRQPSEKYSRLRTIGQNKVETRSYDITVRNQKNLPINLLLKDQIPVSASSQITVEPVKLSGASYQEEDGLLSWNLTLKANEEATKIISYSVRYPRNERIKLD